MAAEAKKFSDFNAFCECYEQQIAAESCINRDSQAVKDAALEIISLLKQGRIASPQFFTPHYNTIRSEMGLQAKNSASHTAKTAEHYRLALIARDMFRDILKKDIAGLGQVVSFAIETHKRFIQKRYNELDELISHYDMNPNLKREAGNRLMDIALSLFTENVDEYGKPTNRDVAPRFSDCYSIKEGVDIDALQAFVAAVKEEVGKVLLISSDRQALFSGGNLSLQNDAGVMPRSTILNTFLLRKEGVRHDRFNPFAVFEEALKHFDAQDERVLALQQEMRELELQCQQEAPIAKAKSEYCNAYAVNVHEKGLIRDHESIYHYLKQTMNEYNGRSFRNPLSSHKDLHKESMASLTKIAREISTGYQKVAMRSFSFMDLRAILQAFERYEVELMAMRTNYHKAYGSEEKAKKSEEYQFIDSTYNMVKQLNEKVKQNPKLNAQVIFEMTPSVQKAPKALTR